MNLLKVARNGTSTLCRFCSRCCLVPAMYLSWITTAILDVRYSYFSSVYLKAIWNTFSACLACSAEGAIEAISLALHSVSHRLKARLNILSLALSCALWWCLCYTHVILFSVEPRLNLISYQFTSSWLLYESVYMCIYKNIGPQNYNL